MVIIVSLHESYDSFLLNRSLFYKSAHFLEMKSHSKIAFVGEMDNHENDLYFTYPINDKDFNQKISSLVFMFDKCVEYIVNKSEL